MYRIPYSRLESCKSSTISIRFSLPNERKYFGTTSNILNGIAGAGGSSWWHCSSLISNGEGWQRVSEKAFRLCFCITIITKEGKTREKLFSFHFVSQHQRTDTWFGASNPTLARGWRVVVTGSGFWKSSYRVEVIGLHCSHFPEIQNSLSSNYATYN